MAGKGKKLNRKVKKKKKSPRPSKKSGKKLTVKGFSAKVKSKKRAGGTRSGTKVKKKKPVAAKAAKTVKKTSKASSKRVSPSKGSRKAKVGTKVAKPRKVSVKVLRKKRALSRKKPARGHIPPIKPPFEAYRGIRPFLFVSYSHRNMIDVFRILKRMYDNRYRIWYDEGIEPGNEWPEVVGKAIVNCSQYLVFMSPSAALSRNVRNEVNLAFTENKEIIVVNLEETRLTSGMKLQIGTVQHINRYEMGEKEFYEKLFKVLKSDLRS
ncbi:MAG: toll/interleukin-1 receptor domain-containing protein [Spirochaetota bacterium]